jgi:hypothetical protein
MIQILLRAHHQRREMIHRRETGTLMDQPASEIPSDNNTVDNESKDDQMSKSADISKTITVDGKTYLKSSL